MLHHLLYVASPKQTDFTKAAFARMRAFPVSGSSPIAPAYDLRHPELDGMQLRVHVLSDVDGITPHLRQYPVDLLIYDERGEGGIEATAALGRIRDDVRAFADLWGPDFLFPMSRVVAILAKEENQAARAFELGRTNVRDVCVAPKNTATILRWLKSLLSARINFEERIGIAFSGGGIEGFLYQMGVTHALSRALSGRSIYDCHVYSGVSSGAITAGILAAKVPTTEVLNALRGKSKILPPLTSATIFDLAGTQILQRIVRETTRWAGFNPLGLVNNTLRSVPTGFFKGEAIEKYFHTTLTNAGLGDTFESLPTELYIGATDQDTYEHVVFGKAPWQDVPISRAMRASCALPPVFVPTQINGRWFVDGQVTKTCNLELVVERACHLVFIIDPLQPLGGAIPGSVDRHGGIYSIIQTVKALVYSRFQLTLNHLAERYPDVDFIVIQPDEETAQTMAGSPMRYKLRTRLIVTAYRGTLRRLRERHHVYSAKLQKYGFRLLPPEQLLELEREDDKILRALA